MKKSKWHGIVKVLRFAKGHWLLILLAFLAMSAYTAGEGAYLVLMRPFVNAFSESLRLEEPPPLTVSELYRLGRIALFLAPLVAFAALSKGYLNGAVLWRLVVDLRNAVAAALMPQSLSFFEGRRTGDLMSRITNDVARTRGAFRLMFGGLPEGVLHILMGTAAAAWASWRLTLLSILSVPLVILPVGYLAKRIRRYGREGLEKLADLTDLMSQMFSGIRVIKAFKMEDAETQEFQRCNRKYLGKMMKVVTARGLSVGTIELVIRAFIGVGILIGAWLIARRSAALDMGGLCVFLGGTYYAFTAMRRLIKAYNEFQECIPAADRIFELIDHPVLLQDVPDAVVLNRVERGIACRDVCFSYDTEPVLRNVSFDARRGEAVAMVGRSGGGKSTLVALICRFYDVTSGAVEIDGIDVRKITRDSLLDRIAIVSQQTFLFNRTIAENIRYGRRDASMAEVEEAARAANIHEFIQSLPDGYDALCGEFGAKLSGGQGQRIAIARAVLKNADILILDEAMAGLDAESESLVREALENLMRGRTTFVITHDLATIRNADRILVLENGSLVGQGTHDELMTENREYRTLYGLQFSAGSSPPPPAGS